ncbi:MAG: type II toxin-antitoxin system VapC family toxin [Victivallales bacterium]
MKESVYVETSVISYLVARPSRDLVVAAHQQITREWWEKNLRNFDVYVSPYVIGEISLGNPEYAELRMKSISGFLELEITPMVEKLAEKYFKTLNIPEKAKLDCFHLAISAVHGIDYLISWNCKHIVNARVKRDLESVNFDLDIRSPMICTPEELLEDRT